jgi:hypothetical protein
MIQLADLVFPLFNSMAYPYLRGSSQSRVVLS